ncbi:MAG: ABC transporter substrate-binding protein [Firmicutes bacterium]|nr:ABC transporter substrate-binding protein [Bacillota bacterium]
MKYIRNIALVLIMALAIGVMTSCTTYNNFKAAFFGVQGVKAETIKIGVLEPQTGVDSRMGNEEIRGIQLAHKLVPNVLNQDIELIYADTQSSIYAAETAVNDLVSKTPVVVLGSYGDTVSLIASQILGEAKIPAITITATNPLITTNNPYYFRVTFTDASQGKALAHYVVEKLGLKKAAIIRMKADDTTNDLLSKFRGRMRRLTENQNCILTTVDVEDGVNDYTDYLQQIQDSGAKAVFMPVNLTAAEKVFAKAEEMGMQDVHFIGPKAWHGDDLLTLAKKYPNIQISVASDMVSHAEEDVASDAQTTKMYDKFVELYKQEFKGAEPTEAAALAFDAYMVAVNAIEKAGETDAEILKDTIMKETKYNGVSGKIEFDSVGEPKKPINVDIIQDGMYVSVFTVK